MAEMEGLKGYLKMATDWLKLFYDVKVNIVEKDTVRNKKKNKETF